MINEEDRKEVTKSFALTTILRDQLKARAKYLGISDSDFIRSALEQELDTNAGKYYQYSFMQEGNFGMALFISETGLFEPPPGRTIFTFNKISESQFDAFSRSFNKPVQG